MDTPLLLLILLLVQNENLDIFNQPLHSLNEYLNTIEINPEYTQTKLKIARKIYPLLPSEYAYPMRKSVSIVEKTMHVIETADYLKTFDTESITPLEIKPRERIQKITSLVQDEVRSSKVKNLGMVLDLIVNMDRYKKILSTYTQISRNKNILSDKESLLSLMETFMEGSSEKEKEGLKDINKMLDIMKLLNTPKKESNEV
ncbi:hypothetical protein E9840_07795 [Tissierella creatinini]|nr:hypothetical protein E9840_07795 [Tissierella creatinini]TJX66710.1 hypothetical protein E8P77_06950 [Soehngenia saccharolytica]